MRPDGSLEKFRKEVLSGGAKACLPCNLSDEWLRVLLAQAEAREEGRVVEVVAAVVTLIVFKSEAESSQITVGEADIAERLDDYQIELGLEQVRRRKDMDVEPATLESIFTERDILVARSDA